MFSWYKYLIVSLVFSHLGFWSGNLFLIAPFPDLCLLVPFNCLKDETHYDQVFFTLKLHVYTMCFMCPLEVNFIFTHIYDHVGSVGGHNR